MISQPRWLSRKGRLLCSALGIVGGGLVVFAACSPSDRHFDTEGDAGAESDGGTASGGSSSDKAGSSSGKAGSRNNQAGSSNEGGEPAGGSGAGSGGTPSTSGSSNGVAGQGGNPPDTGGASGSSGAAGSGGTASGGANATGGSSGTAGTGGSSGTCSPACSANQYCEKATTTCKAQVCTPNAKTCSGTAVQTCKADGSGSTNQNCGSGQICDPNSLSCASPVAGSTWANWPMPNPASAGLPNPASYDVHIAGVVIDNVTKLMWQRQASSASYTLATAKTYCDGLDLGGYTDWKVPTRIELLSLLDFTRSSAPMIDTTTFPGTASGAYWCNHGNTTTTGTWVVYFQSASAGLVDSTDAFNVRCVR